MKALFYSFLIFLASFTVALSGLSAQVTKITEDNGKTYRIFGNNISSDLHKLFNQSDLDAYRHKTENITLKFQDEIQVEIYSAERLFKDGKITSTDKYSNPLYSKGYIFKINETDFSISILKSVSSNNTSNSDKKFSPEVFYIINDKPVSREEYMLHLQNKK